MIYFNLIDLLKKGILKEEKKEREREREKRCTPRRVIHTDSRLRKRAATGIKIHTGQERWRR